MMTLGRRKFDIYASHPYDALKRSVCINQPNSSITIYPIVVYLVYCCPLQKFSTTLQVTLINNKVSFGHYSNLIVRVKRILKTTWTNSDFKKRIDLIWNFAFTLTSIHYILKNPHIFMSLNMAFPTYPQETAFNVGATCSCVLGNGQNQ